VSRAVRAIFSLTIGGGVAACATAVALVLQGPRPAWWLVLALTAAATVGEMATVGGDLDDGEQAFSFATTAHLAAAIVLLPGWAAITACIGTAIGEVIQRARPLYAALNTSAAAFCTLVASLVFHAIHDGHPLGVDTYFAVGTALAVYIPLNLIPPGLTTTLMSGQALRPLAWLPPADFLAFVMEACLAATIALVITSAPAFLLFLMPLLVAVFLSLKRSRVIEREAGQTLRALVAIIDAKDPSTSAHSERVGDLALRLGEAIGLGKRHVRELRWAGRLHDIGKIAVDDAILQKHTPLTAEEWEMMRRHPAVAAELLSALSFTREVTPAVRYHHERADGDGYYRIPPDEIPLEASIVAIVDAFDAMTSNRPYRAAMSFDDALGRIEAEAGRQFDAELAEAFVAMMQGRRVTAMSARDDGWRANLIGRLREIRRAQATSPHGEAGVADAPPAPAR
jgi:putative nucleotidyltransferase with HDIG domain